ncbi:unnamed protein product [Gordionus sp. m RMFG-2023]|uniref:AF4/FMR2 family member 4-like isoform X2 n=1 Tax=Gordionus sp. m RMFG-2023 TaxID=3053472 RepID=UPI0030E5C4F9
MDFETMDCEVSGPLLDATHHHADQTLSKNQLKMREQAFRKRVCAFTSEPKYNAPIFGIPVKISPSVNDHSQKLIKEALGDYDEFKPVLEKMFQPFSRKSSSVNRPVPVIASQSGHAIVDTNDAKVGPSDIKSTNTDESIKIGVDDKLSNSQGTQGAPNNLGHNTAKFKSAQNNVSRSNNDLVVNQNCTLNIKNLDNTCNLSNPAKPTSSLKTSSFKYQFREDVDISQIIQECFSLPAPLSPINSQANISSSKHAFNIHETVNIVSSSFSKISTTQKLPEKREVFVAKNIDTNKNDDTIMPKKNTSDSNHGYIDKYKVQKDSAGHQNGFRNDRSNANLIKDIDQNSNKPNGDIALIDFETSLMKDTQNGIIRTQKLMTQLQEDSAKDNDWSLSSFLSRELDRLTPLPQVKETLDLEAEIEERLEGPVDACYYNVVDLGSTLKPNHFHNKGTDGISHAKGNKGKQPADNCEGPRGATARLAKEYRLLARKKTPPPSSSVSSILTDNCADTFIDKDASIINNFNDRNNTINQEPPQDTPQTVQVKTIVYSTQNIKKRCRDTSEGVGSNKKMKITSIETSFQNARLEPNGLPVNVDIIVVKSNLDCPANRENGNCPISNKTSVNNFSVLCALPKQGVVKRKTLSEIIALNNPFIGVVDRKNLKNPVAPKAPHPRKLPSSLTVRIDLSLVKKIPILPYLYNGCSTSASGDADCDPLTFHLASQADLSVSSASTIGDFFPLKPRRESVTANEPSTSLATAQRTHGLVKCGDSHSHLNLDNSNYLDDVNQSQHPTNEIRLAHLNTQCNSQDDQRMGQNVTLNDRSFATTPALPESRQIQSSSYNLKWNHEQATLPPPLDSYNTRFWCSIGLDPRLSLVSSHHLLRVAKNLKRAADRECDKDRKKMLYIDAVIYFIFYGDYVENVTGDCLRASSVYSDTLKLCTHILDRIEKSCNDRAQTKLYLNNFCAAILIYKIESFLYYKLYRCQKQRGSAHDIPRNQKFLMPIAKVHSLFLSNKDNSSNTTNSSFNKDAQGGGFDANLSSDVSVLHEHLTILQNLSACHELWDISEDMIKHYSTLWPNDDNNNVVCFERVVHVCRLHLNLNCSTWQLALYVKFCLHSSGYTTQSDIYDPDFLPMTGNDSGNLRLKSNPKNNPQTINNNAEPGKGNGNDRSQGSTGGNIHHRIKSVR